MITFAHEVFSDPQVAEILAQLGAAAAPDGVRLTAVRDDTANGLAIERDGGSISVRYSRRVYLFRALGLLCEREEECYRISETARFDTNGVMIDCSRNAVPLIETVKTLIRQLALMGMNTLMLYTEDTYEIPDEPYFGYMRGRYTQEELRLLDEYAAGFGVEIVPCIQTLAHLSTMLQWHVYARLRDTADIMLADEPEVYTIIEKMVSACAHAFKSRRIHVGMDEAHMVGRGKYYDKHGDADRFELMCRHLKAVTEICRQYGFAPMIWSDMFFRLANNGDYYGKNPVPTEAAAEIPGDVSLVYWDYVNDEATCDRMLKAHLALPGRLVFAGGAWKWHGYLPSLRVSISRAKEALTACARNGVRDVFITAWGDDGSDSALFSVLPAFMAQAELGFYGADEIHDQYLARRLKTCTGADWDDFEMLDMPDLPTEQNNGFIAPNKYLLFQDVLIGLFDRNIPEGIAARYAELYERTRALARKSGPYAYMLRTAAALYGVLELKAVLGVQIKAAYDRGDREFLKEAAEVTLPKLITRTEIFADCVRIQWLTENKPFGLEVQDTRIGGLIHRMKTARKRIEEYVGGQTEALLELEEARLPFLSARGADQPSDCNAAMINSWGHMITASTL